MSTVKKSEKQKEQFVGNRRSDDEDQTSTAIKPNWTESSIVRLEGLNPPKKSHYYHG